MPFIMAAELFMGMGADRNLAGWNLGWRAALAALGAALLLAHAGRAQEYYFLPSGSSGGWNQEANWKFFNSGTEMYYPAGSVPNSSSATYIFDGKTATLGTGVSGSNFYVYVGYFGAEAEAVDRSGALDISGGFLESYDANIGLYGTGVVNVSAGTWYSHDDFTPEFSSLHVYDQGTMNITGTGTVQIGFNGVGTLYMSDTGSTLNIGTGGAAGTLSAARVYGYSAPDSLATVNFNHTGDVTFAPQLHGSLQVNKLGDGTTTLANDDNDYTGPTTISAGTLLANGNNSTGTGVVTVESAGTLGGTGSTGDVVVSGKISPGTGGVGTLTTGSETWNGDGAGYVWEITDADDGPGTGADFLFMAGGLDIAATSGSKFTIYVTSLGAPVEDFDPGTSYDWILAVTADGFGGSFAANKFLIDTSGFFSAPGSTRFSVATDGNNLTLHYAAIPEPGHWAAALSFLLSAAILRRRAARRSLQDVRAQVV